MKEGCNSALHPTVIAREQYATMVIQEKKWQGSRLTGLLHCARNDSGMKQRVTNDEKDNHGLRPAVRGELGIRRNPSMPYAILLMP